MPYFKQIKGVTNTRNCSMVQFSNKPANFQMNQKDINLHKLKVNPLSTLTTKLPFFQ